MFKERHKISRRKLLQGLGAGTVLFTPFVQNRLADAAPVGNFMLFATPNGFVRDKFGGNGGGANWTLKNSLQALQPYKQDLTVIRGLCNKSSSTFNSHEDMCKMLSCVHGAGDKLTVYARSFDHELGDFLKSPPLTLGVNPIATNGDIYATVSWLAANKADFKLTYPTLAYLEAFGGGVMMGGNDAAMDLLLARRKSILDFAKDDVSRFKARLAGTDAENLDLYLTSIRDLEKKLLATKDILTPAVECKPEILSDPAAQAEKVAGETPKFKAMGEMMLEIAATAMACGSRRVATLIWQRGSGGINPVAATPSHHDVSHGMAPVTMWEQIDRWYADRYAFLLSKLTTLKILDRTMVVWASEISEEHNQNDCVFVLAGGKALGIKSNQNIVYPYHINGTVFQNQALAAARDPRHRSTADLWVSAQKALGLKKDTVGDAEYCTGGLQELFAG